MSRHSRQHGSHKMFCSERFGWIGHGYGYIDGNGGAQSTPSTWRGCWMGNGMYLLVARDDYGYSYVRQVIWSIGDGYGGGNDPHGFANSMSHRSWVHQRALWLAQ